MNRIRVVHRAGYDYDPWSMASHNEARMTPHSTPAQLVLSHKMEITPTAWQHSYTDYWGTSVLAFEVHEKHPRLSIVATTEVDVDRSKGIVDVPGVSWDDLHDVSLVDGMCEYLTITPDTDVVSALADDVARLRGTTATPADFVAAVQQLVASRVARGSSRGPQHALDAWATGAGSVRDLTHLMCGALRQVGIPARYVSGYCLPVERADIGVALPGELHPWIEWFDGQWVALDPVTGLPPGDLHVEVGHGRDFHDVNPLSGIFTGVRTASTFVEVRMMRLA